MFIRTWGNIENRLDPIYYNKTYMDLEEMVGRLTKYKLRDFIKLMSGGATPKVTESDKYYSDESSGVPFLRVQNLAPEGLNLSECKYINKETHNGLLKRSQVFEGDLLIKITGVGRMAITSIAPKGFEGNINQHMVVLKTKNPNINAQIAAFLNSDIGEMLAARRSTGGTRPALDYKALRSIPIVLNKYAPLIMERAYKAKEQNDKEIKSLLDSLDKYLYANLGIERLIETKNSLNERIFFINSSDLINSRFDQEYYANKYITIQNNIKKSPHKKLTLSQVTENIFSGKTPSRSNYSDEITEYPLIKVSSYHKNYIDLKSISYSKVAFNNHIRQNDIFILSASHQRDYVGRFLKFLRDLPESNIGFVGELICVRANEQIDPLLLFSILNLDIYKDLLNREKRGQTAHIYPNDISKILVPVPNKEIQNEIVQFITNVFERIELIEKESKALVREAEDKVQQLLLYEKHIKSNSSNSIDT